MLIENYTIYDNIQDIYQKYYPTKSHYIHDDNIIEQIYNPKSELIWAVRDYNGNYKISVYDKNTNQLSSMLLQDEYDGLLELALLPNPLDISLSLLDGQNGCQTYFLTFYKTIFIDKTLDENVGYLLAIENDTALLCWNFYDDMAFKLSYPNMKMMSKIDCCDCDKEWLLSFPVKLNENLILTANGVDDRNYFFDTHTMTLGDELFVKGYELRELNGEMVSDVQIIGCESSRLIFYVYQNSKSYYLVSDEIMF